MHCFASHFALMAARGALKIAFVQFFSCPSVERTRKGNGRGKDKSARANAQSYTVLYTKTCIPQSQSQSRLGDFLGVMTHQSVLH